MRMVSSGASECGSRMAILRNAAECAKCGDVIESKHRHDWVGCSCGAIFVDGGLTYIRWGAKDIADIIDRSEVVPDAEL